MTETLSLLFQQSQGAAIEINDRVVRPIFQEKIVEIRKEFLIRRISSTNLPVQGLRIKAANGNIEVNGQSHSEIILWADTSPDLVEIAISSKSGCDLKAWNVWRVDDMTQSWVGNAGIHVNKLEKTITLECSDGVGEVNFNDLVIQIEECN